MKRFLSIAFINVLVICLLIAVAELSGQLVFYLVKGYALFDIRHRQILEHHPYLVGRPKNNAAITQGDKKITITNLHTRYTGKPFDKNTIRVAVLGGSTTFGTGVSDLDSWPALLQSYLGNRYSVINYGVPGYSTAEGIIQLALIVPEIKPHIVVMHEGWNDIRNYHDTNLWPDYYSHGMMQYRSLQIPVWTSDTLFTRLSEISAIFHFAQKVGEQMHLEHNTGADMKPSRTPDPREDEIYIHNLSTMKLLANGMNAYALFAPQVVNSADFKGKKGSRKWTPHIEDDALPELLDKFDLKMCAVCKSDDEDCAVATEVMSENWQSDDFVDDGHFSRNGGSKFAKDVANRIQEAVKRRSIVP